MADDKQERAKAIEAALAQIDKQFGKGSIMRLGSRETIDVPAIPTGSLSNVRRGRPRRSPGEDEGDDDG